MGPIEDGHTCTIIVTHEQLVYMYIKSNIRLYTKPPQQSCENNTLKLNHMRYISDIATAARNKHILYPHFLLLRAYFVT